MKNESFINRGAELLSRDLEVRCRMRISPEDSRNIEVSITDQTGEATETLFPRVSDDDRESLERLVSFLSESLVAILRLRYEEFGWGLRCEILTITKNAEGIAGEFIFIAQRSAPADGEKKMPGGARAMVVNFMMPVIDELLTGAPVYMGITYGENAELNFPDLKVAFPVGPCTYETMQTDLMPSLLRFLGNEIRKIDATGDPAVQGAIMCRQDDDSDLSEHPVHLLELTLILRQPGAAH